MTAAQPRPSFFPTALRTAAGLSLAPVVGGAIALPIYLLVVELINGWPGGSSGLLNNLFGVIQLGAAFGGYMGVIPAFLFGVPVHAVLMRTGKTHLLFYIGLGPVIALVSFAIVGPLYGFGVAWGSRAVDYIPIVLLCGGLGGVLFWLLRRPDRDTRTPEPAP